MGQFIVTPESGSETFLELSRTKKGRLFKKHILSTGKLYANGTEFDVDEEFLNTVVKNFNDKKCDIVQVPIVTDKNMHSEDPNRNIGEVVDLKVEDGKLYSFIDSRKEEASNELGNTLIGASAMLSTNYKDTSTNELVGPTLLHVAITNRPHVLNLEDFEEIVALSSDGDDEIILTTSEPDVDPNEPKENNMPTREELIATLKSEHDIDVEALQSSVTTLTQEKEDLATSVVDLTTENTTLKANADTAEELAVKLSASIQEHLSNASVLSLSAEASETDKAEALIGAVADAGTQIVSLSSRIDALENDKKVTAATAHVDELIAAGRILPVNKEAMVELRLSNSEIFDKIVPETPIVELSAEDGTSGDGDKPDHETFLRDEVARLKGQL